ncbi:MAG: glucose-6-phosphate isomerase [Betaproteobacteria bacterium]|nr:glucose-6-phosphate isomerase [Betaproteobacteria bacterium]
MPSARSTLPSWQALIEHQRAVSGVRLRELFARDPARYRKFSLSFDGMIVDYSKQALTGETIRLLIALARECGLESWTKRLFAGERVNATENRAALHAALRAAAPVVLDGRDVARDVKDVLAAMGRLVRGVRTGRIKGATGRALTDVVNLGIGGSDLGPRLACEALGPFPGARPRLHFVSNVDGAAISSVLAALDPRATLFVIASKTFTTQETLANARAARAWLAAKLGGKAAASRHLCAVTAEPARAVAFGVPAERVLRIWDWVGGRYSLWSAVGLPIALAAGMKRFDELRAGARAMDEHFAGAPLERNLPVALGLLEVWNATFRGVASRAVVPYDERLRLLPAYLQQLEMESCGKHVSRGGEAVDYATAPVTWGSAGTDGQHAYFQLLHQGTAAVTADFIACCRPRHRLRGHHDLLLANFLAQTEALAFGMSGDEAAAAMRKQGLPEAEVRRLLPHRVFEGGRPTTSILLDDLSARALGALIALYEHKVFVQSVIWDVNAFDQWGVELGKRLADRILPELGASGPVSTHDSSTNGLINHIKAKR